MRTLMRYREPALSEIASSFTPSLPSNKHTKSSKHALPSFSSIAPRLAPTEGISRQMVRCWRRDRVK